MALTGFHKGEPMNWVAYISEMVLDAVAPFGRMPMGNHHTDSIVIIVSGVMYWVYILNNTYRNVPR